MAYWTVKTPESDYILDSDDDPFEYMTRPWMLNQHAFVIEHQGQDGGRWSSYGPEPVADSRPVRDVLRYEFRSGRMVREYPTAISFSEEELIAGRKAVKKEQRRSSWKVYGIFGAFIGFIFLFVLLGTFACAGDGFLHRIAGFVASLFGDVSC